MKNISKHLSFILLLALLCVIYIFNTHKAEKKLRKISHLKKEVEDAKSEYQEVKSDIIYKCTESQLAKSLENKGLKKNESPPIKIDSDQG
ncbi:MAG: hypothetical protein HKO89_05675 [Saprospiraceae bacterium]|nr:hypothetical protein [Bacteroidia bacterium]MBT8268795.1 hypothetical protein [Bacteroidia bacterium]NNK90080.1 hypothetical protein [Saprospiraceae bacterium]